MTLLAYSLLGGTAVQVTEVPPVAPANNTLQPWDRAPQGWQEQSLPTLNGGGAQVTGWNYTVPTGKILRVEFAECSVLRTALASAAGDSFAAILANGEYVAIADIDSATVGATSAVTLPGALDLFAGESIGCQAFDAASGGTVIARMLARGYTFNA
jgi:hypothetical protein